MDLAEKDKSIVAITPAMAQEFAILLLSLHQHVEESALAVVGDEAAEEYIWNGNTQGNADDCK